MKIHHWINSLCAFSIVTTPLLFSCGKQTINPEPPLTDLSITIKGNNYGFSNNVIESIPYIVLSFNIDGAIKDDDILAIYITDQRVDHVISNNLDINVNYKQIKLRKDQKEFDVKIDKLDYIPNKIFKESFNLTFKLFREETVIFVTSVNNLYFYNATPIFRYMLDIKQMPDGDKVLWGFVDDEDVKQQLSFCNFLFIPDEVDYINNNAFYRQYQSTIPIEHEWSIYFGDNFGSEEYTGKIKSINEKAFYDAKAFKGNLSLPKTIENIGISAFENSSFDGKLIIDNTCENAIKFEEKSFCSVPFSQFQVSTTHSLDIGREAFYGNNISNLSFDKSIESLKISDFAFSNSNALEGIELPINIQEFNNEAFSHCMNLKYIQFWCDEPHNDPQKPEDMWTGADIFSSISSTGKVYIPNMEKKDKWIDWFNNQWEPDRSTNWDFNVIP